MARLVVCPAGQRTFHPIQIDCKTRSWENNRRCDWSAPSPRSASPLPLGPGQRLFRVGAAPIGHNRPRSLPTCAFRQPVRPGAPSPNGLLLIGPRLPANTSTPQINWLSISHSPPQSCGPLNVLLALFAAVPHLRIVDTNEAVFSRCLPLPHLGGSVRSSNKPPSAFGSLRPCSGCSCPSLFGQASAVVDHPVQSGSNNWSRWALSSQID